MLCEKGAKCMGGGGGKTKERPEKELTKVNPAVCIGWPGSKQFAIGQYPLCQKKSLLDGSVSCSLKFDGSISCKVLLGIMSLISY